MKTLEEMIKDFSATCKQQPCERCKYKEFENMGECGVAYAFEQLLYEQLVGNEVCLNLASTEPWRVF